ncbi:hypothetical protein GCM10007103_33070 [Salinimicrobium marinum]|uniref:Uncharacterized protein n=1 Tax=Salinimicrobium marinum TaxID=680283 RepID=A0A918SLB2_9FLAO|nr:hypothetical protein [Salinimicrobium marinum]GHA49582.1 hypothetical protein GCM10007103_33070 [Salinimicrobium marinum]
MKVVIVINPIAKSLIKMIEKYPKKSFLHYFSYTETQKTPKNDCLTSRAPNLAVVYFQKKCNFKKVLMFKRLRTKTGISSLLKKEIAGGICLNLS